MWGASKAPAHGEGLASINNASAAKIENCCSAPKPEESAEKMTEELASKAEGFNTPTQKRRAPLWLQAQPAAGHASMQKLSSLLHCGGMLLLCFRSCFLLCLSDHGLTLCLGAVVST